MSFFLVFLAIALIGVAVLLGTRTASKIFRRRCGQSDSTLHDGGLPPLDDGFDEPGANLPPVLLPAEPEPADVDRLRFAVGLRGYRMDQVDQVLDELRDRLAAKDLKIAELGADLDGRRTAPGPARE
ncbi:DivIVA domain-containing protein [Arthrobacter sp. CG_A4]|uniref:DivIVA domain-containing protein n=1 Tax=Arthrobacter sp. CG_A4 TaxID=3071706 RepID=UPI002E102EC9